MTICLGPAAHSCMGGKRFYTPTGTAAFCEKPVEYVPTADLHGRRISSCCSCGLCPLSLTRLEQEYGVVWSAQKRLCGKAVPKRPGPDGWRRSVADTPGHAGTEQHSVELILRNLGRPVLRGPPVL